jgi:hypothetical protein
MARDLLARFAFAMPIDLQPRIFQIEQRGHHAAHLIGMCHISGDEGRRQLVSLRDPARFFSDLSDN